MIERAFSPACSSRQGIVVSVGLAVALFFGCSQSAGPVTRVTIDPDLVENLVVQVVADPPANYPFVASDRKVILRCVAEVNGLSYTPYRPEIGSDVGWEIVFQGKGGSPLARFAFSGSGFIMVAVPDREHFFVKFEKLPTVRALSRYRRFHRAREALQRAAAKDDWSEDDRTSVQFDLETIKATLPRSSLKTPGSPSELAAALQPLGGVSLDDLDEFIDPGPK